jgi:hypothetical protein
MTEMTAPERRLLDDLDAIAERVADEKFATALYRAVTRSIWHREGEDEALSPSFQRAGWLVNRWRERHGQAPLDLDNTGGEGEVDDTVAGELGARGWTHRPLDTSRHHPGHEGLGESPPPPDHGERMAPVGPSDDDERRAHEEADAELRRKGGV